MQDEPSISQVGFVIQEGETFVLKFYRTLRSTLVERIRRKQFAKFVLLRNDEGWFSLFIFLEGEHHTVARFVMNQLVLRANQNFVGAGFFGPNFQEFRSPEAKIEFGRFAPENAGERWGLLEAIKQWSKIQRLFPVAKPLKDKKQSLAS